MSRWAVIAALLSAASASAQTYEHRGSLGLTIAGGGEYATAVGTGLIDNGWRTPLELGGTWAITDRNELRLAGRLGVPINANSGQLDWSAYAGLRNSRGERFKTFFDLDLAAHFAPLWTIGVRVGFGVQYEVLPVMGLFAVAAAQGGGGAGLRLTFELMVGVQFRTYVLL